MKRLSTLFLILTAVCQLAQAQVVFQPSGGVTTFNRNCDDGLIDHSVSLKNNHANQMYFRILRTSAQLASGHTNSLCVGINKPDGGICYPPTVDVSEVDSIGSSETIAGYMHSQLNCTGGNGTSIVTFRIRSWMNNPAMYDSNEVTFTYNINNTTAVALAPGQAAEISAPYPNPAHSSTSVNYTFAPGVEQAELRVFDLLGKQVHVQSLNARQGTVNLNVAGLRGGIYFLNFVADGKTVANRRLTVNQ